MMPLPLLHAMPFQLGAESEQATKSDPSRLRESTLAGSNLWEPSSATYRQGPGANDLIALSTEAASEE